MSNRPKISIIGAGNVGREVAYWCAVKELGDIVLWNRTKETAMGHALDLMEAGPIAGFDAKIIGTGDIRKTRNSDVIVFTAGIPRKPGQTREELVQTNAKIVGPLVQKLARLSPKSIFIMVANPLDAMSYLTLKKSRFHKRRVIGMAGVLDSSRFRAFIARVLGVSIEEVSALVLGSHGEAMVPLPRLASVAGVPITSMLSKKQIKDIVDHTKRAGAQIVQLLKANASFSVGASAAYMVESILKDQRGVVPASVYLDGEYGMKGIFLGVPVILGRRGVEDIVKLKLDQQEKAQLRDAGKKVRAMIKPL